MANTTTNFPNSTYLLEEDMVINGKWKIQNFIAKGGKGEVYLAKQLNLDRQVALKIMSQDFIKSLEDNEDEIFSQTKRFQREVQVMARLKHPYILQVYDFDQLDVNGVEMDYIVMEYVPGPTLRHTMIEDGLGHDERKVSGWLKKYFFPILDGMKVVHDKGVVHRDMKPENVLVDDGSPKIMDFGIAGGRQFSDLTQTHHMVGTITYMPEEQFMDLGLTDARVDVYALGKIIYEVVEGKIKKGRDKPFNKVSLHDPQTAFFLTLDRIIQQATAQNRNMRTPSVQALHDSLKELIMGSQGKRPTGVFHHKTWKSLFAASVIVLIVIVVAVTFNHYSTTVIKKPGGNNVKLFTGESNSTTASLALPQFQFNNSIPTAVPDIDGLNELPATILASDSMAMILLTGAEVFMPLDADTISGKKHIEKQVSVKTLYMDKTKITNHLYVQFLNEVDGIAVRGESVFLNEHLLLLLGEVRMGYEPITFKNGKFRVTSDAVTKPVVRVTPVGALAYAQFYGKSLPLMKQWWLAVQAGQGQILFEKNSSSSQSQKGPLMMQNQNPGRAFSDENSYSGIIPVTRTESNSVGIHGLEQNVSEWTMSSSSNGTQEFHIHGGVGEFDHREDYLKRQSWESFSEVGFRTVLELDRKE